MLASTLIYQVRLRWEGSFMIQHFKFKPLFENTQIPGWSVQFFYKQTRYTADYKKDGSIQYTGEQPDASELEQVNKMIHELMLFHVYD